VRELSDILEFHFIDVGFSLFEAQALIELVGNEEYHAGLRAYHRGGLGCGGFRKDGVPAGHLSLLHDHRTVGSGKIAKESLRNNQSEYNNGTERKQQDRNRS
jgi:hypothetical protein